MRADVVFKAAATALGVGILACSYSGGDPVVGREAEDFFSSVREFRVVLFE
jgi:hypothetical protein